MSAVAVAQYPRWKRRTAAGVLFFLALWMAYVLFVPNEAKGEGVPIGKPAPDFELKTIDGTSYKLSDLKGKTVMLNFFATWCPSCRAEMPAMEEVYKEYKDKDFIILAVDLNESDLAIRSFTEKFGLTFPIIVDKDDRVSRTYEIVNLPTSYFIDKTGVVRERVLGEMRKEQMRAIIEKIQ
ncbi:MAG TPA: thiol-disulfide oxidoreductase ResA [Symbiobacteriaceae bacterium]|nr:thiol-disulfide oxidoreductase ResA [Symbiobacteriaceae bacterium]